MKFRIIEGNQVSADLIQVWRLLQDSNPDLSSPFFCPEYSLVLASVQNDARIAVIENRGSIAGIFPFQIGRNSVGKPIGTFLSDYHGIICSPDFCCDTLALLRACGMTAWDFDHLVASQRPFLEFHRAIQLSPILDLTRGFACYLEERRSSGSELAKKMRQQCRRLEREVGELRFEANSLDKAAFDRILSWKSHQYLRTGASDVFSVPWVLEALNLFRTADTPHFAGTTSVLYAGAVPIAGHFGLRSSSVWHYWFPSYAPEYHRYSPGSILLYKMAEAASTLGLRIIDLGKGPMLYKERFKNAAIMIAEGSVERMSLLKVRRQLRSVSKRMLSGTMIESKLNRWRGAVSL